tara:strand:- start:11000 stop:11752 length:753 start_codon:yes stop_codon:yes gene_type:complete
MLVPTPVKRVQFYSRNPHAKYVDWILNQNGIFTYKQEWYEGLLNQPIRSSVDDLIMKRIKEGHIEEAIDDAPSWVDAAFGVLKDKLGDTFEKVEDIVDEIFEDEEYHIEEEEEKDVEEVEEFDAEEEVEEPAEEETEEETVEEVAVEKLVIDDTDNPFGGEIDYNSYTVRELQAICKERGITIRGTKSEVVLRLRRHDAGIVEQPTKGEIEAPSQEAAEVEPDAPSQEAATEEVTQHDDSRQEPPDYEEE